jgi:hypothetical protein
LAATDLTGGFCTSGTEREFTLKKRWYADEEIQAKGRRPEPLGKNEADPLQFPLQCPSHIR